MIFRTRFAPSPTGPLHLGHAYSAILGFEKARQNQGKFLLRMEDTDFQRSKPEWEALICEDLNWLGLDWDGAIHRQSEHLENYQLRLDGLDQNLLYPCSCTRGDIRAAVAAPQEDVGYDVYPGTCRHRSMSDRQAGDAIRLNLEKALSILKLNKLIFTDTGPIHKGQHNIQSFDPLRKIGDIVLSRKNEDVISYFLSSAFDDADQNITDVVRGRDLFDFTPIQVILQNLFGLPTPIYHHHDLIRDENGKRLAKRDDARSIRTYREEGKSPNEIRKMIGL